MPTRRAVLRGLAATAAFALISRPWRAALAHGPTRVKLVLQTDVNAPPDKVWAVMGNFQDLSWAPSVASVTGTGGNTPNEAHRTIVLKKGGTLPNEELDDYDATTHVYSTFLPHVDPKVFPVADYSAHFVVTDAGNGKSHVEIRTAFYRGYPNNDPPPDMNEDAARAAVTSLWQPALDALKARFH
jgi:hypothetical protein